MFNRLRQSLAPSKPAPPEPAKETPKPQPPPQPVAAPAPVPVPAPVVNSEPQPKSHRGGSESKTASAPVVATPPASSASVDTRPPIDWKEALNQVGGDREFLQEVLQDLLDEAKTAEEDIGSSVRNRDFGGVMRAAHRIKGSASYLSCNPLKDISYTLQQSGHEGEENPTNAALWPVIEGQYTEFIRLINALRLAIAAGIPP